MINIQSRLLWGRLSALSITPAPIGPRIGYSGGSAARARCARDVQLTGVADFQAGAYPIR